VTFDAWWARAADRDITKRFQTAKELADSVGMALDVTVPGTSEVGAMSVRSPSLPPPSAADATVVDPPDLGHDEGLLGTGTRTPGGSTSGVLDPVPTPAVPLASRAPLVAGVAAGVLALAGLATLVAMRAGGEIRPRPGATSVTAAPATATATVTAPSTTAAPPSPSTNTTASAAANAPPPPSTATPADSARPAARSSSPVKSPPPAVPRPTATTEPRDAPKPKTDFGI
jgi:hypothetical protein